MLEIWKQIKGTDCYEISSEDRIRRIGHYKTIHRKSGESCRTYYPERIMKPSPDQDGYLVTSLFYQDLNRWKYPSIHRLVAEHFLSDWDPSLQVNHIDGNKTNNCVDNLEMVTCQGNIDHFWKHPLMEERRKQKLIRVSAASKEVMSRPDVKIREAEKQGTHVLCIEDNIAFASRSVCAKYYGVGYDLVDSRCKNPDQKIFVKLPGKHFRYMSEFEYQSFKKENPEKVVIYV